MMHRQITVFGVGYASAVKKERWVTHTKVVAELSAGLRLCLKTFFNELGDSTMKWPASYIDSRPREMRTKPAPW